MSARPDEAMPRDRMVEEVIQAFVELVLIQKHADMPCWMDFDLTVSQLRAVYLLAHHGLLSIGELAGLLKLGNPATSLLVQQLVQHKLAERSEDIRDRRRTFVRLTERGAGLVSGRREAQFHLWLSQMDDESLAGLRRGLIALLSIMHAAPGQPGRMTGKADSPGRRRFEAPT